LEEIIEEKTMIDKENGDLK